MRRPTGPGSPWGGCWKSADASSLERVRCPNPAASRPSASPGIASRAGRRSPCPSPSRAARGRRGADDPPGRDSGILGRVVLGATWAFAALVLIVLGLIRWVGPSLVRGDIGAVPALLALFRAAPGPGPRGRDEGRVGCRAGNSRGVGTRGEGRGAGGLPRGRAGQHGSRQRGRRSEPRSGPTQQRVKAHPGLGVDPSWKAIRSIRSCSISRGSRRASILTVPRLKLRIRIRAPSSPAPRALPARQPTRPSPLVPAPRAGTSRPARCPRNAVAPARSRR